MGLAAPSTSRFRIVRGESVRRFSVTLLAVILLSTAASGLRGPGANAAAAETSAADGRAIYRITPPRGTDPSPLFRLGLDPAGHGPGASLDFVMTPGEVARARALGFDPVLLPTLRGGPLAAPSSPLAKPNLGLYHTYSEAAAEMASYAAAHPAIARLDTIGVSLEGRAIPVIKISDNAGTDESEPEVLIVGCHHARELMSVEIPLYVMRRLLDGYGADPALTALVDSRQIWIVPVANPDGYVYVENNSSGQSNGWWRKNRRPNADGSFGVDLNRNYSYQWGYNDAGSSPFPPAETYRGTGPFSEPEAVVLRDFIASRQFTASASFHSYGGLVLYPWGYDLANTSDHAVFAALGDSMASQNGYRAGNPKSHAIYLTNGEMDDWLYGENVLKPSLYGFTFEVNTAAEGGFEPAETLIGPTCALNWGPVLTLLRYGDAPRRVIAPPGPANPRLVPAGGRAILAWSYPAPDPANPPVRHDVRRIDQVLRVTDDAEAGPADWDTLRFDWSTARHASGARSYYSGSADTRVSVLTSRATLDGVVGDSLVVYAWWSLEAGYDYWYAQASGNGGATWQSLIGNYTTNSNPSGNNEGSGITGSSGGVFARAAFNLLPFAGRQALVRFRCVTDNQNHLEGLYLDDVAPTPRYVGVSAIDTGSPDSSFEVTPAPTTPTWLAARGVDAEGQPSPWSDRRLFQPSLTSVAEAGAAPASDRITGVVPNPMNPRTEVRFTLAAGAPGPYRLDCYDAGGRWVGRVTEGADAGRGGPMRFLWSGRDRSGRELPSGIYFLRLTHGSSRATAKVTLLR
jgi:hypothetical protein